MNTEPQEEMSFIGHLMELRKHLIRMAIALAIGMAIVAFNVEYITDHIILAPAQDGFYPIDTFNNWMDQLGWDSKIEFENAFEIQTRRLYEQFNLMISISFFGGLILSFPIIVLEIWRFILPALKPNEKKYSAGYIVSTIFFFILGALFGYFILSPLLIQFGINYTITNVAAQKIDISSIITSILQAVISMGVIFLMPVFVYFLTILGILTPTFLTTYRKHAIIVIFVIAGFITPADWLSMLIAAIPLYVLFEMSVLISKVVYKRMLAKEKELVV